MARTSGRPGAPGRARPDAGWLRTPGRVWARPGARAWGARDIAPGRAAPEHVALARGAGAPRLDTPRSPRRARARAGVWAGRGDAAPGRAARGHAAFAQARPGAPGRLGGARGNCARARRERRNARARLGTRMALVGCTWARSARPGVRASGQRCCAAPWARTALRAHGCTRRASVRARASCPDVGLVSEWRTQAPCKFWGQHLVSAGAT